MHTSRTLTALLSLLSISGAHMLMKTPIPYGRGTIDNSPLKGDGSDFPCKNFVEMTDPVADVNHMAIGEPQTLSFTGSAVHGGGSCQVSLTTDLKPTKQSKWMVIKSIEGGCPASADGNLNGNDDTTFQYTVPSGIAPGQYSIAWSWVNRIGNREFYMNCGRADITAAKKKRYAPSPNTDLTKRADFPDMFVANIPSVDGGCATLPGFDYKYPNPGAEVTTAADGKFSPEALQGCGGAVAGTDGSSGNSSSTPSSSGEQSGLSPSTTTSIIPAATTSTSPAATSAIPGVFASGAAPAVSAASSATVPSAAATPLASSTAPEAVQPTPAVPAPAAPNAAGSGASGTCSEGNWMCAADGKSFQRCASGAWSVPIPMAAGTTCTVGESANLSMKAIGARRRAAKRRAPTADDVE